MAKWADYAIRCRTLDSDGDISGVRAFEDQDNGLGNERSFSRSDVVASIERGVTFVTTYRTDDGKWRKGEDVHIITVNGVRYIRTDANSVAKDNLGELPDC